MVVPHTTFPYSPGVDASFRPARGFAMARHDTSLTRRRRTLAVTVLAAGLLAALVPVPAGALSPPWEPPSVVANPGPVELTISGGSLSIGGLEVPLPECDGDGGQCLAMTADLAADGTLRVRASSLQLPAIEAALDDLGLDLPVGLRVEAYTSGGIGGVFLPEAGLTRLELGIGVRVVPELSALPGGQYLGLLGPSALSCGVGPVRLSLTSGSSGGLTGVPYDPATGALTLVDGAYVVPPVTCSPLLLTVLQALLGGSGGSLGGIDLGSLLGDFDLTSVLGGLGGLLGDVDPGALGIDLGDLSSLDLTELLATVNAAVGLPSAPGTSGTSLTVTVQRSSGGGAIEGGGVRWPALTFTDVPRGGEVEQAVRWLAATGITTGVGGDPRTFAPRGDITRGQMAAFLWRMMDKTGAPAQCGFTDVTPTAFFATAVCWLKAEGITTGTGDGTTFSPGERVTRSQMARFLWRLAGEPEGSSPANFADVSSSAGFAAAVDWLRANGITQGLAGTNSFAPSGDVTRSQMAQFLHRLASRVGAWGSETALPRTIDGDYRCLAIGHCPPAPPCYRPDGTLGDPAVESCTGGPMIPGGPGSTDPGDPTSPDPGDDPVERPIVIPDVIGLTELRAIEILRVAGYPVRVVERDGRPLPATMDFRADRVNLIVRSGTVIDTRLG